MGSIWKSPLEIEIITALGPWLEERGFRLVDLDARNAGKGLLRLFVEKAEGKSPSLEDCSEISRALSPLLEEKDWFHCGYDLEVSSPGIDRRLRTDADFGRVAGSKVRLKLRESVPGLGKSLSGRLVSAFPERVRVEIAGRELDVQLEAISQGHLDLLDS